MAVLVHLAESPGEVLSKEKLLHSVWPDTFVSDDVLTHAISELRHVFGDNARESRVIQTIHKRGYRLIAPVTVPEQERRFDSRRSRLIPSSGEKTPRLFRAALALSIALTIATFLIAGNVGGLRNSFFRTIPPAVHSLAVLPLQNLSGDPSQEYFADGMTEELITELSGIGALKVISRTSSMHYKNADKRLPEIARELDVDAIVEGSIVRSGNRVRITAQLISARDDKNVWARTYERELRDSLKLQSEVASSIAEAVRAELAPREQVRLQRARSVNLKSLDAYLKGSYSLNRFGAGAGLEESDKAIDEFQQAIAEDPGFAQAYVALSDAYARKEELLPLAEVVPLEKKASEQALALDPDLADTHAQLGAIKAFYEWDWKAGELEIRRALELDPNNVRGHEDLADYIDITDSPERGMTEHQRAQELDPTGEHLSNGLIRSRQYDRAIELLTRRVEVEPEAGGWHYSLSELYALKGRYKESIEELRSCGVLYGYKEEAEEVRKAYDRSGYQGAIREFIKIQEQLYKGRQAHPLRIAEYYLRLGDRERAFRWLETSYKERDDVALVKVDPQWDPLRSDPRFNDLLRRIGLLQ